MKSDLISMYASALADARNEIRALQNMNAQLMRVIGELSNRCVEVTSRTNLMLNQGQNHHRNVSN